jgi:hypothetical protein
MKTVAEFIADWKVYGDEKEFVAALWHFQSESYAAGVERDLQESERLRKDLELERMRLDWLDYHCSFVADDCFNLGPFKPGELRKLADAGMKVSV